MRVSPFSDRRTWNRHSPVVLKNQVSDLAIAGGVPMFREPVHVGRPNIGDRDRLHQRIDDLLDRRSLTNDGIYVQEFEQKVADIIGVAHCIAMCNGTVALETTIQALGLTGEVIVPSFTFIATAHALQSKGVRPVFCDIDPGSQTIDPSRIEERITAYTTGILGVHLWGRPCDITRLSELAKRYGLALFFDAAHAFGSSFEGSMIGTFGRAEIFSFHATKFLNTFEGGAVVTNDGDLAERLRLMRNFGFASQDQVAFLGTNGKMSEVAAAMGLTGLESMENYIAVNRRHYEHYRRALKGLPGLQIIAYNENERCNYQYVVLDIDPSSTGMSRDELIELLRAENVLARRYFYPGCHRLEPYRTLYPNEDRWLPETEKLGHHILCLPSGTALSSAGVEAICSLLRLALNHSEELSPTLRGRANRRGERAERRTPLRWAVR